MTTRSVAITARNAEGKLVGVAFGITDFVYFLFVTDLGVDKFSTKRGIGSELLVRLQEAVGGEDDITVITVANEDAIGFYEKCGYISENCLFWKPCKLWSKFTIT